MTFKDRQWWLQRLSKQVKDENEAHQKQQAEARAKMSRVRKK